MDQTSKTKKAPRPELPNMMMEYEKYYTLEDIKNWLLRMLSFGRIRR